MDTITHGVAGALIAKSLSDSPAHKIARRAVILGSLAPDLDLIAGLFTADDVFQLEFHRGITHSVVALPAFAAALAFATVRGTRGWSLIAGCYGLGIASHIFLDVITAYGTMIFQPLSRDRYTWDMVFIIDLTLGSLVLIPQLVAWAWSDRAVAVQRAWLLWLFTVAGAVAAYFLVNAAGVRLSAAAIAVAASVFALAFSLPGLTSIGNRWPRSRYCRAGLALCALYLAACATAHHLAVGRVRRLVSQYAIPAQAVAALPAPPSLLRWNGLISMEDGFTRIPLSLLGQSEPVFERYINTEPLPNSDRLQTLTKLQTYLWFARFPWVTAKQGDGGAVVEYRDLQFLRPSPRSDPPFTFRVHFDQAGNLVAAGLSRR